MTLLFEYPEKATFGRVLPKNKIYEHASPTAAVKELFVRQVDQIVWKYKLAPETINLKSTKSVPEVQIFHIGLKKGELKEDVLRCIDKAIPFPLIYELRYGDQVQAIAAYKRPNEADSSKWVLSEYFATDWLPDTTPRTTLPVALNLAALYEKLFSPLLPHPALDKERIQQHVERMERIRQKQRELDKMQAKLGREKQFNRKVEINAGIRAMKQEIKAMTRPAAAQ